MSASIPSFTSHRVSGWLIALMASVAALVVFQARVANATADGWAVVSTLPISVLLLLVFARFEVSLHSDELRWQFGWLGVPRWRLPLSEIQSVELQPPATWTEGYGIRFTRHGMLYNLGPDPCLRITRKNGKSLRVACPDAAKLAALLALRLNDRGRR